MITLTDNAVAHLRELLAGKPESGTGGLRVGISRGGCAGLQYEMSLDAVKEGDFVLEKGGVRVLVGPDSIDFLRGSSIDYSDDLAGEGFRIINPNAARSCGCGTSFEPASAPAGT